MLSLAEGPGADLCGAHDEPLRVGVGGALPAMAERQLPPCLGARRRANGNGSGG
jgi:hypothetical protein